MTTNTPTTNPRHGDGYGTHHWIGDAIGRDCTRGGLHRLAIPVLYVKRDGTTESGTLTDTSNAGFRGIEGWVDLPDGARRCIALGNIIEAVLP